MKICGRLAIDETVKDTQAYKKARDELIVDPTDDEAIEQADLVMARFSSGINMKAYDKLYGSLYGSKKARMPAKPRKSDVQPTDTGKEMRPAPKS